MSAITCMTCRNAINFVDAIPVHQEVTFKGKPIKAIVGYLCPGCAKPLRERRK